MDCVVVAGGRPGPDDPLYAYTNGKPKALISLAGRTMLEYVVNGLQAAGQVQEVVVVGLTAEMTQNLAFSRPVAHLPDQGSLFQNARAGLEWCLAHRPEQRLVLVTSADIPLLCGSLVDAFIAECAPLNAVGYYPLVRQETMETQFPGAQRTYARLKDKFVAGGDMVLVHTRLLPASEAWGEAMTGARKQVWKLVRLLGLRFLIKYLFHQLTVADVEDRASRIAGGPVKIFFSSHAALAMDADKPHQLEILRRQLGGQPA